MRTNGKIKSTHVIDAERYEDLRNKEKQLYEILQGDHAIVITRKEYDYLNKRDRWLGCLEIAGVDNWEGYDYAVDIMQEGEGGDGE